MKFSQKVQRAPLGSKDTYLNSSQHWVNLMQLHNIMGTKQMKRLHACPEHFC